MKYYEILGVSEDASQKEIKEAYREKVKETHPDQSDDPNAAQLFMQVQEAYDVLSDPDKRAEFDSGSLGDGHSDGRGPTGDRNQSRETHSTAEAKEDGVGWRAQTRQSEEADHIWEQTTVESEKPPHPTEFTHSWVNEKVGTWGMAVIGGFAGIIFVMNLFASIAPSSVESTPLTNLGWVGLLIILISLLFFLGVVERLLRTERRLTDPPGL